MAKHILAVLGTSLYEPVVYTDGDFVSSEQEFIQLAMVERFKEELDENDKITIFITDGAKKQNYEDRNYSTFDVNTAKTRWVSLKKEQVSEGALKKGLETQFNEQFPHLHITPIEIPNAQTEEQNWEVFDKIYEAIDEEDEIIFDITHSFRSIPMLAMAVINYAKILKNCTLKGIYYGAYEAGQKDDAGYKKAPINDLTIYDEILDWSNAANVFMKYGNASMMRDLLTQKKNQAATEDKKMWGPLEKLTNAAGGLSDAIQASRGADKSKAEVSIKSAYNHLANTIKDASGKQLLDFKPFPPLFEKVQSEFSVFDKKENFEVGMEVTGWAIKNEMIQQGYTALEETIKTYICRRYGLDEISKFDREDIASKCLVAIVKTHENKFPMKTEQDRINYLFSDVDICAKLVDDAKSQNAVERKKNGATNNINLVYHYMKVLQNIFADDNCELADIAKEVGDNRNDINHFGMRDNAAGSKHLMECLKEQYEKFCIFVENHPVDK